MNFATSALNNLSLSGGPVQILQPTPVTNPVAPVNPAPSFGGNLTLAPSGSATPVIATSNTSTTTPVTVPVNSNAIADSSNTVIATQTAADRPGVAAPGGKESFLDKYKVWAIPGIAFIVILIAMYFFMKAKN